MVRSPKLDAPPTWRLFARFTAAFLVALTVVLSVLAPRADAQDHMIVASGTTYSVDVENDRIFVEGTYQLSNNSTPVRLDDGTTRHRYFTHFAVAIPHTAVEYTALVDGVAITTNYVTKEHYVLAETWFPAELRYDDKFTLNISYVIPDSGPRADWGGAHISNELVDMTVWAQGSPGQANVSVVLPAGYDIDFVGSIDGFTETTRDGKIILTAHRIPDASDFYGQVLASNENIRLENTSLTLHSGTAVVLSRPSDPEWRDFVVDSLQNDLPVLDRLIGMPWPHGNIVVEQSSEPRRDGFGGWYDSSDNTISFETVSRDTLLHEFSHAWFNHSLTSDRWINEGLADEFASRTIEASGGERPDPPWPDPTNTVRIPLEEWEQPDQVTNDAEGAFERFHYDTSWWVFRQITDDIGLDAFSEVLVNFAELPERHNRTWQTLYAILDERADVDDANLDALFGTYVTASGTQLFQQRRAVLASYNAGFVGSGVDAPDVLLAHMAAWEWADMQPFMDEAAALLPQLLALEDRASRSLIDITSHQDLFKSATNASHLERLSGYISTHMQEIDQLEADRASLTESADAMAINITFDVAPLDAATVDTFVVRTLVDRITEDRLGVAEAAAAVGIAITFRPARTLEGAQLQVDSVQAKLDLYIERSAGLNERMEQLGLDASTTSAPMRLELATNALDERASILAALVSAKNSIADLTATERAELDDKDTVSAWLTRPVEGIASDDKSELTAAAETDGADASTDNANSDGASGAETTPVVPVALTVGAVLLAGGTSFVLRNARNRRDQLTDNERLDLLETQEPATASQ